MRYLRHLIARTTAPPRLVPRLPALYEQVETRFDTLDDDVVVEPSPERTPRAAALPQREPARIPERRIEPASRDEAEIRRARGEMRDGVPEPRDEARVRTDEREAELVTRRVVRLRTEVERRLVSGDAAARDVESGGACDVPLLTPSASPPPVRALAPVRPMPSSPAAVPRAVERERVIERGEPATTITVAIGRIDVRTTPAPAPARTREEPFRPRLSLEEYLAGRNGGRG